jgi:hypothetical protein
MSNNHHAPLTAVDAILPIINKKVSAEGGQDFALHKRETVRQAGSGTQMEYSIVKAEAKLM